MNAARTIERLFLFVQKSCADSTKMYECSEKLSTLMWCHKRVLLLQLMQSQNGLYRVIQFGFDSVGNRPLNPQHHLPSYKSRGSLDVAFLFSMVVESGDACGSWHSVPNFHRVFNLFR